MKFLILSLFLISSAQASTKLLVVGGGARPPEAMAAFVQAAGGAKANILVSSWASETTEGAESVKAELLVANPAASVSVMPTFPMIADDEAKLKTMIQSATGIFFAGGDQTVLMKAIFSEKLKDILKTAYQNGVVFGGTSAGTAIMSERMISGDAVTPRDAPPLAEGLGLLPNYLIVDQHFILRQRFNRLASLVLGNANTYGLGIDEGMAVMITDGHSAQVMGPTSVIFFSREKDNKVGMEFFQATQNFRL